MTREELLLDPFAFMPPARLLDGLSPGEASRRVPGVSHSIVEIVAHLVFWESWFLNRCCGVALPMAASAAEGWPAASAADWEPLRERFLEGLRQAVLLPDGPVEPPIEFPPFASYTVTDVMTHLAQHNAHHLGQIVTLRQLLGRWPPPEGSFTW
jgi:uncharacterized damage-inducible protein DinB